MVSFRLRSSAEGRAASGPASAPIWTYLMPGVVLTETAPTRAWNAVLATGPQAERAQARHVTVERPGQGGSVRVPVAGQRDGLRARRRRPAQS